jgi:hypothetical protein
LEGNSTIFFGKIEFLVHNENLRNINKMDSVMLKNKNYLIGLPARFHHDIPFSSHVRCQINGNDKKLFSRPRFTESGDKTCQSNSLQEHTVAVLFISKGYDLADDQRQGKASRPFEPDAEVIFWTILPRQIRHATALDEHRKLPGQFSEDENKYSTSAIRFEACLLDIHELISRVAPMEEGWKGKVSCHCVCLQ